MEANRKQNLYRSIIRSVAGVSMTTAWVCGLGSPVLAQSVKKTTSDPYYSAMRQAEAATSASQANGENLSSPLRLPAASSPDSFYQPAWSPPKTPIVMTPALQEKQRKAEAEAEVWSSVARKATKPVTRIDFSRLNIEPKKKANATLPSGNLATALKPLKPANIANSVSQAANKLKTQTLTPIKDVAAKTSSIIRQRTNKTLPAAISPAPAIALRLPKANTNPPAKASPLMPHKNLSDFNMPKLSEVVQAGAQEAMETTQAKTISNAASRISAEVEDASVVQQAQFGQNIKKLGDKIKSMSDVPTAGSTTRQPVQGARVADASSTFYTPAAQVGQPSTPAPAHQIAPAPTHPIAPATSGAETFQQEVSLDQSYRGESFENSRVLALVGGHPIFVGDLIFEVNQLLEKYMKGAPQEAKDAQKGKLMSRLLPKYVDQKILYVSTVNQLPEGADMDAIIKQAETTFNDKALPSIMENSEVESIPKFDAVLRSQGSSVRQMRRTWAKDQIAKFFLAEKVKFNRKVTHLEMLDEYRSNYDTYAVKGKVRFEQIEVQPAKAGGRFAAKDKIEDISDRIVHGANFEAIAKKESHGFKAFNGGQYDWTSKGSLVNKKVDEAIFSLPQGQLSGVIESKTGFHLIRVIERVEDHHTPFTEAQVAIKKRLLDDRRDVAFRDYIEQLKQDITVEYVNE